MERETTKVTTPIGKIEVTIKSWFNGGEKMEMSKVEQSNIVEWLIKTAIVTPNIEVIKELHGKDFDFLLNELNSLAENSSLKKEEKKN